jgi:hypothetical protein
MEGSLYMTFGQRENLENPKVLYFHQPLSVQNLIKANLLSDI